MAFNYRDNSTSYAFSGTEYENPSHGTARLNYIPSAGSTVKLGFTTDTSASEYCKLRYAINNQTAYIGRYSSFTTPSMYETTSEQEMTTGGITYSVSNEAYSVHDSILETTDLNPWNSTGAIYSLSQESLRSLMDEGHAGYYTNSSESSVMEVELDNYNFRHPNATLYTYDYSLAQESQEAYKLLDYYPGTDMTKSTSITSNYELYNVGNQTTGYYSLYGKKQSYIANYGWINYTTNFTRNNTGSFTISYTSSWNGLTGYFTNTSRKIIGNPWWGAGAAAFKKFIAFSTNNQSTIESVANNTFYDKTGTRFILTSTDGIKFLNTDKWKTLVTGVDCMRYFSLAGNGPMAIMSVTNSTVNGKSTTFAYKYTEGYNQYSMSIDAGIGLQLPTTNTESQMMAVHKDFSGTIRTYDYSFFSSRSSWDISASYSSNRYSITVYRESSTTTNNFNI